MSKMTRQMLEEVNHDANDESDAIHCEGTVLEFLRLQNT